MASPAQSRNRAFGQNLRHFRKQRGLRQADLARKVSISQPQLSRFERGGMAPDVYLAADLAAALEMSVDELLRGVSNEAEKIEKPQLPAAVS